MSKLLLRSALIAMFCCALLVSASFAQSQSSSTSNSNNLSRQDKHFLEHLAKDSQGEVQISQMVVSKTSNPQVKQFAQKMVDDHTMLNNQLKQVMDKKGMSMPQPMTSEQQQVKSKLQGLSGSDLDNAYMQAQVQGHQKDVQEVSQFAQSSKQEQPSDPDVSNLAAQTLPILKEHLNMANQVASQVGATSGQGF